MYWALRCYGAVGYGNVCYCYRNPEVGGSNPPPPLLLINKGLALKRESFFIAKSAHLYTTFQIAKEKLKQFESARYRVDEIPFPIQTQLKDI